MYQRKEQHASAGFWVTVKESAFLLLLVFIIRTIGFGLYQVPTGSMETTMLVGERFFADKFTVLFRPPTHGDIISFNDPTYTYSSNRIVRLYEEYVWGPSNWTKRVIGVPGDTIRGVIENGKPVIYRNGEKLQEPYLNQYPLIAVYRDDPQLLLKEAEKELLYRFGSRVDLRRVREVAQQMVFAERIPKSYDPSISFENQPFYRIDPSRVVKDSAGNPLILIPGEPLQPMTDTGVHSKSLDEFEIKLSDDHYWVMGDNRLGSRDCRFFGAINKRLIHGRILFRIWSVDSDESWWIVDLIKHPIDFFKRVRWNRFFQMIA